MTALKPQRLSPATHADLPAVLALLRVCELPETGVAEFVNGFWVAREGSNVVACAGLEVHEHLGLLRSVAVEPAARGSGFGTALVRRVVATARELGLAEVFLLTTTAAPFFERLGFSEFSRSSAPAPIQACWEFRAGCPKTARAMRLAF